MKKLLSILTCTLLSTFLWGYTECLCEEFGANTYTSTLFYTEGGCCSGIAVLAGIVDEFVADEGDTYQMINTSIIPAAAAQDKCCNKS